MKGDGGAEIGRAFRATKTRTRKAWSGGSSREERIARLKARRLRREAREAEEAEGEVSSDPHVEIFGEE